MFCATTKTKQFKEYTQSEKHHLFCTIDVDEVTVQTDPEIDHADLKDDQQFTFCVGGKHDLDITSKSWGFYLTPSLFSRCKKFDLHPFFLESDTVCKVLMVFSDYKKTFTQVYNVTESDNLYRIDEKFGVVNLMAQEQQ